MIDAHLHLGKDFVYDGRDTTEEDIERVLKENGLKGCVLFPANTNISLEKEREQNERVRSFAGKSKFEIFGICQVNPHYTDKDYKEEVVRYVSEGFKGISVNPEVYGWSALTSSGERVFRTAFELKLPLFVSTGVGLPLGMPINLLPMCEKYSDVKVVMMHTGKSVYANQSETVGEICENVYFETSLGLNMRQIKARIKKFGARRVIMGSELLSEVAHSIYCYENCGISDEERAWSTEKSILSVFNKKEEK